MSRTTITPPECGVYSHLCGSSATESARSMPRKSGRSASVSAATPPYAPSTCSHSPCSAQTSAISSIGSMAPVDNGAGGRDRPRSACGHSAVARDRRAQRVDAHAQIAVARDDANRVAPQAEHVGGARVDVVHLRRRVHRERRTGARSKFSDRPARACVARGLERDERRHRAARRDVAARGRPAGRAGCANQRPRCSSISVAPGESRQPPTFWLSAAASRSAAAPGTVPAPVMYAMKPGMTGVRRVLEGERAQRLRSARRMDSGSSGTSRVTAARTSAAVARPPTGIDGSRSSSSPQSSTISLPNARARSASHARSVTGAGAAMASVSER